MECVVHYTIDDVGYAKTVTASSAEVAQKDCEDEMKATHPLSACAVTKVEEVEKVKKSKKKSEKDEEE